MGALRYLLAISVVVAHSGPIFGLDLVGGRAAVEIFFMISGFYMALILKQKYDSGIRGYKLFLTNRILRIYPLYWVIIVLTLLASLGAYLFARNIWALIPFVNASGTMTGFSLFAISMMNLTLFGQDLSHFRNYSPTTGFSQFLIVPQSWTLALEMMFYLMAPFLVKMKTWLLGSLIVARPIDFSRMK